MARRMRLTREESRAQTKLRLLDAARHLFAQGGYGGASIDAISAEAGYSKGAFYSNFESKEQIFLELLGRHMAEEAAQLKRIVTANESVDFVLDSLDAWLEQMNQDADWALLAMELQLHARRTPDFAVEYDALHSQHRAQLAELLSRLFDLADKQPPAPSDQVAAAMIALAHGLVLQRTTYSLDRDPAGVMLKIILRSLLKSAKKNDTALKPKPDNRQNR